MTTKKEIIVPYIDGAYFFYNVLDMAIFLYLNSRNKETIHEIKVNFYRMPFWLNRITLIKFLDIIKKVLKIKSTSYKNFIESNIRSSAYTHFRLNRELVINYENCVIYFCIKNGCHSFDSWIKAFIFSIKNYWLLKDKNLINVSKLMNLKFDGIEIGTSVGSSCLRNSPKAHGSIQKCSNLFMTIMGASYFINFIKNNLIGKNIKNIYVIPTERYFLHSLFVRAIRNYGGNILDGLGYKCEKAVIASDQPYHYYDIPFNNYESTLTDLDKKRSIEYLNKRIYSSSESLWYMFRGANDPNLKLINENRIEIHTAKNELYAVVFLHQFEDGQYSFGYDGFDDIYEWSIFTIDTLLNNLKVSKIFVKCHPNASSAKYPGDELAIKNIADRYKNSSRIVWLDSACGPLALKNSGLFVGITKHGSIAEELASIDIPSISSICSRWTDVYKFSKIWRNKEEYRKILSNLSIEEVNMSRDDCKDNLYKYIRDYRIQSKNIHQRQSWYKFAWIIDKKIPTPLDFNFYNNKLSELALNSIEFDLFKDYLVQYNISIINNKIIYDK